MSDSLSNLEWLFHHCIQHHYFLDIHLPVYYVAKLIMEYILKLDIAFVSNKVKTDFAYHLRVYTQSTSERLPLYVEPIAIFLMQLMKDENFSVGRLKLFFPLWRDAQITVRGQDPYQDSITYAHPEMVDNIPVPLLEGQRGQDQNQDSASSAHPEKVVNQPAPSSSASNGISHMPNNAIVLSPLASREKYTPLISNISDKSKVDSTPQQQNQLSSVNLDVKLSPKLLSLLASPKLHPVNLEDNFKAANVLKS
jgi:hypothetical protein